MSHTLYATFARPEDAEKAAGDLLNLGVRPEDLSVVRQPHDGYTAVTAPETTASNVLLDPADRTVSRMDRANGEVTNEAPLRKDVVEPDSGPLLNSEAASAAWKGAGIGAGVGAVVALVAMLVPGVGLVIGAGALASALAGVAATAGVGAAAGAITAYMKDLGVDEETASEYGAAVESGGAVLAVTVPSGPVDEPMAMSTLKRYSGTNLNRYATRGYVS